MDDSAIAKIKAEVSSSVTKTYAESIFKQISVLSKMCIRDRSMVVS